jgi:hypothetical protein
MENDLAEIKERQDQLEAYLNALESRVDWQEGMLQLVDAKNGGRTASRPADLQSEEADVGETRPGVQDAEALLRSVVLKQRLHGTTLRSLEKTQERGQSRLQATMDGVVNRLDSITATLRRIEGGRRDR